MMTMKQFKSALFLMLCLAVGSKAQVSKTPFTIGETVVLQSEILGQERPLSIYLPYGFSPDSAKTYPVIYLLDGSADQDFLHIAGLVQFASYPWLEYCPESIVVGIANLDRTHDFTAPPHDPEYTEHAPTSGGSADFMRFIAEEVQPYIAATYPLSGERTLIGQSLGGLLATEILFTRPDLFDNYMIVSPSLWWDNEFLLDSDPAAYSGSKSIYIAVGEEGKVMKRGARQLHKKLQRLDRPNTRLFFKFFPELNHADALHLSAYDGFKKLFWKPESKK
ncbi:MAG: alpha/beta hydrolase [Phaeodactylibacter sp.]|nr:alpha/beta hydrolase [Phaeodactylibacter sp.]